MVHNQKVVRRPRGRPQVRLDEETRQVIVTAARQEFHANGYAGASMARVAERAGLSTKTMYRLIPTKADLFRSIISERIARFVLDVDENTLDALPIAEALEHLLTAYGTLTLDKETVSTFRLVLAECDRFPEIATSFSELAISRARQTIESWLKRQRKRGKIELDDLPMAAGVLRGMMAMEMQRAMMLGQREAPERAEIAKRARYCAHIFLNGCRPQRREDPIS